MNNFFHKYSDKVNCYVIYILEAHPKDELLEYELELIVDYNQPDSIDDRRGLAKFYIYEFEVDLPVYVDSMNNNCNDFFGTWPTKIMLLNQERVLFHSEEGPEGFKINQLEEAFTSII
mmetsp:Transcript_17030/g.17712  ORF Transcript_17030/g.17712 Transcript_17030/m.17712 type:complete len:118 (-) Transcript_17030:11-364(-)